MTARRRPALFDVRPGEGRRLYSMGGAMAAILAAHTIAETARDSMFLRSVAPEWLAIVYVGLAGLAVIALKGNSALIRRVGRRHALVSTLMSASYGTTMFYILGAGPTVAFGLYLWTGLLGTILIVQFWLLAGATFTSSEAKRLFGLLAAMAAVGALVGASAASALVLLIDVEQLLPIAAGLYLLAGLTLTTQGEVTKALPSQTSRAGTAAGPIRLRDHPYVARLAVMAVLGTMVALVSDYLLKTTAVAELSRDELPSFFARYNTVVSIVSLLLQVVGASWLMRKVGVLGAVTLLPLALAIGGGAILVTSSAFAVVVLTKGTDATLRHSVNRVSAELLWMPVRDEVRASIREPLDSVVSRVVQAITAAALLALGFAGVAGPTVLAGILVGLAGLWFVTAASLRSGYLSQLRSALLRPTFDTDHELDVGSLEVVVEALSSLDDRRVTAAIQVLQRHNRSRLIPALLLRHDSPVVLGVALDAIAVEGRTDWIPLTKRLLSSSQPSVRIAAIRALARAGERAVIERGLADQDPGVRANAVFWEVHLDPEQDPIASPDVAALLHSTAADAEAVRTMLVDAIRDAGDARWAPVLLELARTSDPAMIAPLARAIERVPDVRFLPILIDRLATRAARDSVRAALVAIGEPAIEAIELALRDPATNPRVRLQLPTALALFGTQRVGDILLGRLAAEDSGAVRYQLLRAITRLAIHHAIRFDPAILVGELEHHLREHFSLLGLSVMFELRDETTTQKSTATAKLVCGLLNDKISQARDRVFLVLEAIHPRDDVRSIERAFESSDRATRAHAFEFLDTLIRTPTYDRVAGVRDAILVAYEDLAPAERVARVRAIADPPASSREALIRMVRDSDSLLAACAAYHALQLGPSELATQVIDLSRERPLLAPLGLSPVGALGV